VEGVGWVVVSGGNVDPPVLEKVLRMNSPDLPGGSQRGTDHAWTVLAAEGRTTRA